MKLLLSKLSEIDGDFTIDKRGETRGHTQLRGLMIRHGSVEVEVSIAGTVIVEPFAWPEEKVAEGVIQTIDDLESDEPAAAEELRVQGLAKITFADGTTDVRPYVGILYTTGYLRRAWLCVRDPEWDGTWAF